MAYVNIVSQQIMDINGNLIPLRGTINADGSVSLDTSGGGGGTVTIASGTYFNVVQLPAATALVDDLANPTTTTIGAAMKGFDGKTWDRIRTPSVIYNMTNIPIGPSTGGGVVATPSGSNKFRLMGGIFSVNQACSVQFFDNTTGSAMIVQTPVWDANGRAFIDLGNGYLSVTGGYPLRALASVTGTTIIGYLYATEE